MGCCPYRREKPCDACVKHVDDVTVVATLPDGESTRTVGLSTRTALAELEDNIRELLGVPCENQQALQDESLVPQADLSGPLGAIGIADSTDRSLIVNVPITCGMYWGAAIWSENRVGMRCTWASMDNIEVLITYAVKSGIYCGSIRLRGHATLVGDAEPQSGYKRAFEVSDGEVRIQGQVESSTKTITILLDFVDLSEPEVGERIDPCWVTLYCAENWALY
eukprot:TRINITY_DN122022_c0_g1_i1.p1 TRINITY_DN122022_c0_g1~~TRINITY_DN122022_c0_g1_i1.p1  ORF type:complete len:222 (+),score=18.18 TRINITY_DN122022_c0_g1_i1:38-703(+)